MIILNGRNLLLFYLILNVCDMLLLENWPTVAILVNSHSFSNELRYKRLRGHGPSRCRFR